MSALTGDGWMVGSDVEVCDEETFPGGGGANIPWLRTHMPIM